MMREGVAKKLEVQSSCRAATNLIEVGVLVAVNIIILYTVPDSVHLLLTWKARERQARGEHDGESSVSE